MESSINEYSSTFNEAIDLRLRIYDGNRMLLCSFCHRRTFLEYMIENPYKADICNRVIGNKAEICKSCYWKQLEQPPVVELFPKEFDYPKVRKQIDDLEELRSWANLHIQEQENYIINLENSLVDLKKEIDNLSTKKAQQALTHHTLYHSLLSKIDELEQTNFDLTIHLRKQILD